MTTIKKIGVFGAGVMGGGSGIAHLAAANGFEVVLCCVEQRFVDNAIKRIANLIDRKISKQKMTFEEKEEVLNRITITTNIEDLATVDLVIEAIFDDIEVKKSTLEKLDKICGDEIVLCSNSSNISITELASATSRPDKVVGLKFLNPPQIMRQVQVLRGYNTSDETLTLATKVVQAFGKNPVIMRGEALRLVKEAKNAHEVINTVNNTGGNYEKDPYEMSIMA